MENKYICNIIWEVNLYDFLSVREIHTSLFNFGIAIARMRGIYNAEDASDIAHDAFLQIFEEVRKPHIRSRIEHFTREHAYNYLKIAMKNRCTNIAIKKNKEKAATIHALYEADREDIEIISSFKKRGSLSKIRRILGIFTLNFDRFSLQKTKEEIYFFVEENYGRSKWESKKEAINIFFKRFEEDYSLEEIKKLNPDLNIASLNTEAHRTIEAYLNWLKQTRKSSVFEIEQG